MFQMRIHGRGGQGVVTGAEMLSVAAFFEGRHAQAFPSFGSERTGAPLAAFCRIADKEIAITSCRKENILSSDKSATGHHRLSSPQAQDSCWAVGTANGRLSSRKLLLPGNNANLHCLAVGSSSSPPSLSEANLPIWLAG